ncbi:hypothetical protein JCGZ_11187 [Jatropha curcas]|uniref:Uncharacterized protein n=1 Tax=Jatropha curcas TaxID=180498 RepID=A0A067KRC0_JATCU|nr:hypothetical protein JCGZ_11187 [Jatropha curcas]
MVMRYEPFQKYDNQVAAEKENGKATQGASNSGSTNIEKANTKTSASGGGNIPKNVHKENQLMW